MDEIKKISGVYVANPENAPEIRNIFKKFFETLNLTSEQVNDMLLAMGEIVVNSIEHAYKDIKGLIAVEAYSDGDILTITIEDFGIWLNPEMPQQITRGRGIFIAEILSTTFEMTHKIEGGTKVKIRLKISP